MQQNSINRLATAMMVMGLGLPVAALAQTAPAVTPPAAPTTVIPSTVAPPVAARSPAQRAAARSAMTAPDRVEQRINEMHSKLHVTAAQQPQWDAFATVMRSNATDMRSVMEQRSTQFAKMTALDNMQSYSAMAQQHAQALQKLVPAFQTLYASFSDEQKKAADDMFRAVPGRPTRAG